MTFNLSIEQFKTPDFATGAHPAGWYLVAQSDSRAQMCTVKGPALLSALQSTLRSALKPPYVGIKAGYGTRVALDGYVGQETIDATWAYMRMLGWPETSDVKRQLATMIEKRAVTPAFVLIAIMLAYYRPRVVTPDNGAQISLPPRVTRTSVPDHVVFQSDKLPGREAEGIFVASNARVWPWMTKPAVVEKLELLAVDLPSCSALSVTAPTATHTATRTPTSPPTGHAIEDAAIAAQSKNGGSGGIFLLGAAALGAWFIFGGKS